VYSQKLGGMNAAWIGVAVLGIGVILLGVLAMLPARGAGHRPAGAQQISP
jgi:hypothetical protein